MKAPNEIKHADQVTDEHTQWLYNKLVQMDTPISSADLTKAVGRILKAPAKMEALDRLVHQNRVKRTTESHKNRRRVETRTLWAPCGILEVRAPLESSPDKPLAEWLS